MANPNPRTWSDLNKAYLNGNMDQYPKRFAPDIARLGWYVDKNGSVIEDTSPQPSPVATPVQHAEQYRRATV